MRNSISFMLAVCIVSVLLVWVCVRTAAGNTEQPVQTRLQALEARVQQLEDIESINRLQRIYGYYLDKRLWDQIVPLFTDDCVVEIGGRGVYKGKEHVANLFTKVMGQGKNGLEYGELHNHLQLQGVVDVDPGGKTAKGRWRAFMQVASLGKGSLWAEGPYEIEYEKVNGKWMFKTMHWYPTYYVPFDKGWDKLASAPGGASIMVNKEYPPDAPPSGPVKPFPDTYVPPFHYTNPITGK
jgi:hypothetical protein